MENEMGKEFTLEFRVPANTKIASVSINGEKAESKTNIEGFVELHNKWKKGDKVEIDLEYELKVHVQVCVDSKKWIAFTYGPLALAQRITEMPDEEPFSGLDVKEPSKLTDMLLKSSDQDIHFSIKGTEIDLIPYYQTSSKESGPKTYFKL
jgi:DUF1680 family protein